jgi:CRP-like cAMP-binding protein
LICIVKSGKIELNNNKNKQILQKRDLFGKKYLFNNNEVYPYTSIALEDSEIFLIHKDDIETLVEKDKSIGFKMFKHTLNMLYEREQNER